MRIQSLRVKSCPSFKANDTLPAEALDFMTPDEYLRENKENHPQSHM